MYWGDRMKLGWEKKDFIRKFELRIVIDIKHEIWF